jgi:hypothetical protein
MNPSDQPPPGNTSQGHTAAGNAASVCGAFMNAFSELGRAMAPPENVERHFREARKQALMGLRELIDNRIQQMSRDETKGTRVNVD